MANGSTNTREELLASALVIADEEGLDALTIRELGKVNNLHHTALYRHFSSKEELIAALLARLLEQMLTSFDPNEYEPADRLIEFALMLRRTFAAHPGLIPATITTAGPQRDSSAMQWLVVTAMEELGLSGDDLVIRYQAYEDCVLGSLLYDYSNYPTHASERMQRHRQLENAAFDAFTQSEADVELLNYRSFEHALRVLVAECVIAGARA